MNAYVACVARIRCNNLPLSCIFVSLFAETMEERKRKGNFTDTEIRKLIELYSQHRDTLTAKQSNIMTNKKKQTTWSAITEEINSCSDSGCLRSEADVKKKWKDLLSKAKKDASAKKTHQTGGGPPPKTSVYSDIIVDVFGEDSPAFTGLAGVESGGCSQPLEDVHPEISSDHSDESSNTGNCEGVCVFFYTFIYLFTIYLAYVGY